MIRQRLAAWGFDPPRLVYGLRTAAAACLALALGQAAGLEHPQWSAMTVWIASQPLRGQLLEKSFFRLAGTCSGTLAGLALLWLSGGQGALLVPGLALWVAACAGIGNLQRGFVGYGTLLAGYTAAMVALVGSGAPGGTLVELALDRLLTVGLGVLVALAASYFAVPSADAGAAQARARMLAVQVLQALAARLRAPGAGSDARRIHALLQAMAALDQALDPLGAGLGPQRRAARALRVQQQALVAACFWLGHPARRGSEGEAARPTAGALAQQLDHAAAALAAHDEAAERLHQASQEARPWPELQAALLALAQAQQALDDLPRPLSGAAPRRRANEDGVRHGVVGLAARPRVVLHRDWIGARGAALRAGLALLVVGGLWQFSGRAEGAFLMLGTAVMLCLFSTADEPARMMGTVLRGQLLGVAAALVCRWVVWPAAGSAGALVLAMMPFVMLGALLYGHRRSAPTSFDYTMGFLILLQPAFPPQGTLAASLMAGLAVALAPVVAMVAFRWVAPANARRRRQDLVAMIVRELQDMASRPDALQREEFWRARLRHRWLRLVRWVEQTGAPERAAVEGMQAAHALGDAILHLHRLAAGAGLSPAARRAVQAAQARLARTAAAPERAAVTLERAADRLAMQLAGANPGVAALRLAAQGLRAQPGFFRVGAPGVSDRRPSNRSTP